MRDTQPPNMSTLWINTNLNRMYPRIRKWLVIKMAQHKFRADPDELISAYVESAMENDRLAHRLNSENGNVKQKCGLHITESRFALYCYLHAISDMKATARHNVDVYEIYRSLIEEAEGDHVLADLKRGDGYHPPMQGYSESIASVGKEYSNGGFAWDGGGTHLGNNGYITTQICDIEPTPEQVCEEANDATDEIEQKAIIKFLSDMSADLSERGKVFADAETACTVSFYGGSTQQLRDRLGRPINNGNARKKLRQAEATGNYAAQCHRDGLKVLTILSNGGRLPSNTDNRLIEYLKRGEMVTEDTMGRVSITEFGRTAADFPTTPSVLKECLFYYWT